MAIRTNSNASSQWIKNGLTTRVVLSLIVALLVTAIMYTSSFLNPTGYSLWQLPIVFGYVFTLWQMEVILAKRLDRSMPWNLGFSRRLFREIGFSLLFSLVILNVPYTCFKLYSEHPGSTYNVYIFLLVNSLGFIFYLLVTALHMGITFLSQWLEAKEIAGKLREENSQAKILRYQEQLNPHFVFNNLNIVTALIDKDPESAKTFVEQFSASYRYLLLESDKELVTLKSEIDFLESYLYLLKVRFQQSLQTIIKIPDELLELYVPPFSLQLLIENCIKHNVISQVNPLVIEVLAFDKQVMVRNNRQPKLQTDHPSNKGLTNIQNRYQFFTDLQIDVKQTSTYFSVSIPLLETNEYSHT
ncbi:MAG: histidine kinase [Bacteroidota bacterium]